MGRVEEDLLARHFIQRRTAKARQKANGDWYPVTSSSGERLPWYREDLEAHVDGRASMGHYLVDEHDNCKLFAFDIDLSKEGEWIGIEADGSWTDMPARALRPREAWLYEPIPANLRRFLISCLREVADTLAHEIEISLDIPVVVSESGNKGLHVYGLTGTAPAADVRQAAIEIIQASGKFELWMGVNFYRPVDRDVKQGMPCVDIEVFPKQGSLEGKDLGNLMRLPLGKNAKSGLRSRFIDIMAPIDTLEPITAEEALGAIK